MKVLYHAWIAEKLECHEEAIHQKIETLAGLIDFLKEKGAREQDIFSNLDKIYIAVNSVAVNKYQADNIALIPGDTISFFPPVSGG